MHYKLLGFSQIGTLRTFWFHGIGPLGSAPVPCRVLADTRVARKYNLSLQELPSLCSRMLNAGTGERPPDAQIMGECDISMYAAESAQARAEAEAARKKRALQSSRMRQLAPAMQAVKAGHAAPLLHPGHDRSNHGNNG